VPTATEGTNENNLRGLGQVRFYKEDAFPPYTWITFEINTGTSATKVGFFGFINLRRASGDRDISINTFADNDPAFGSAVTKNYSLQNTDLMGRYSSHYIGDDPFGSSSGYRYYKIAIFEPYGLKFRRGLDELFLGYWFKPSRDPISTSKKLITQPNGKLKTSFVLKWEGITDTEIRDLLDFVVLEYKQQSPIVIYDPNNNLLDFKLLYCRIDSWSIERGIAVDNNSVSLKVIEV
jgi:hypothetical protein